MANESETSDRTEPRENPAGGAWLDRHIWQIQPVRDLLMVASIVGLIWLGYRASIVTVPLLLAIALAYLVEPIILNLARFNVRRKFASVGIIVGIVGLIGVPAAIGGGIAVIQGKDLVMSIGQQTNAVVASVEAPKDESLRQAVPEGPWRELRDVIVDLQTPVEEPTSQDQAPQDAGDEATDAQPPATEAASENEPDESGPESSEGENQNQDEDEDKDDGPGLLSIPTPDTTAARSELGKLMAATISWTRDNAQAVAQRAASVGVDALDAALATLGGLVSVAFALFLTMFFFFFVCNGWGKLKETIDKFIPDEHEETIHGLLIKFDRVIAGFVRGRLIIALLQGVVFTVGYWIVGVPVPLILGPAVAVLSIVPYLAIVGIPISIVLLYIEPNGGFMDAWWWTLGAPMAVYYFGQALDDYVWTPKIQGKETGMGTASILFATFAGGAIMGFYGLLLAIPLAACIKIVFDDIVMPAIAAWGRGEKPDFLPFGRQR